MPSPEDKPPFFPEKIDWKDISASPGSHSSYLWAEQDKDGVYSVFKKIVVPVDEIEGPHVKQIRFDRIARARLERTAVQTIRLNGHDLLDPKSTKIQVSRKIGLNSRIIEANYNGQRDQVKISSNSSNHMYSAFATYYESGRPTLLSIRRLRTAEKWAEIMKQEQEYKVQTLGENVRDLVTNFIYQSPGMPAFLPDINLSSQRSSDIDGVTLELYQNKQKRSDKKLAKWTTEVQREVLGRLGETAMMVAGFYRDLDFAPTLRGQFVKYFEQEMAENLPDIYDLHSQKEKDAIWEGLPKKTLVDLLTRNYIRLYCLEEYGVIKELSRDSKTYEFRVQHETYGSSYVSSEHFNNEHSYDEVKLDLLTNPRFYILTIRNRQPPNGFTRVEFDKKIRIPTIVRCMNTPENSWIGALDLFKGEFKYY